MSNQFMSMAEKRRFDQHQKQKREQVTARRDWSDEEICQEFDSNPNITIAELATLCGKSVKDVKKILLR